MNADLEAFLAVAKIVGLRLSPWQVQVLELMYAETDVWCPACAGNRAQQHALPHHTPREETDHGTQGRGRTRPGPQQQGQPGLRQEHGVE